MSVLELGLDKVPIRMASLLSFRYRDELLNVRDQVGTLEVIGLLRGLNDVFVGCRDDGNEEVHHDNEHDQSRDQEEQLHHSGHSIVVPLHVELSQAQQVRVVEVVEDAASLARRHDEVGAAEGAQNEDVEQEERLD